MNESAITSPYTTAHHSTWRNGDRTQKEASLAAVQPHPRLGFPIRINSDSMRQPLRQANHAPAVVQGRCPRAKVQGPAGCTTRITDRALVKSQRSLRSHLSCAWPTGCAPVRSSQRHPTVSGMDGSTAWTGCPASCTRCSPSRSPSPSALLLPGPLPLRAECRPSCPRQ